MQEQIRASEITERALLTSLKEELRNRLSYIEKRIEEIDGEKQNGTSKEM